MSVETITKYKYQGVEYNSIKDIQSKLHDTIGEEVLDKINKTCEVRHKDLFKMLEILCDRSVRNILQDCYSAIVEVTDEEGESYDVNVLDY